MSFEKILDQILADGSMSRTERQALRLLIAETDDPEELIEKRRAAFAKARATNANIDWLEEVVSMLSSPREKLPVPHGEAFFGPNDDCGLRIVRLLDSCETRADICVFTITDDRITRSILAAAKRGVALRIITDDDKSLDRGSDVGKLEDAGIPVRRDRTEAHMHHKFAIFDGSILVNGSFNWTRGASEANQENVTILHAPILITAFQKEFDRLWKKLG